MRPPLGKSGPAFEARLRTRQEKRCVNLSLRGNHVHQEVNHTVGVAPLVVIPRNDLEEPLLALQVVLQRGLGVVDGGVHVVNEVRGHQLLVGIGQNALHVALRGGLQQAVNLLNGGVLLRSEGEVHHRDVRSGHAEGHAREFAFGAGQHLTDSLGCASGRRNDVAGCRTASTPVLGGHAVHRLLRGSVSVDGGHETLLDPNALLEEDVADGCQAVGSARGVGHYVVVGLVVLGVVHATHEGLQGALARSRDDDFLGTSLNVSLGLLVFHEEAGGLNHVLHVKLLPRQSLGTLTASHDALDLVAIHDQLVLLANLHVVLELAVHSVVLHLVRKILRIGGHVNNAHDVKLASKQTLIANGLENHSANAAESIDANLGRHGGLKGEIDLRA
mmetsp:Transcript_27200/g.50953  ORF Transcript_27200/g.50953 Transcript_27200/m.50953 type:complete len:388 (+) Transcript_27200:52-1215(+)